MGVSLRLSNHGFSVGGRGTFDGHPISIGVNERFPQQPLSGLGNGGSYGHNPRYHAQNQSWTPAAANRPVPIQHDYVGSHDAFARKDAGDQLVQLVRQANEGNQQAARQAVAIAREYFKTTDGKFAVPWGEYVTGIQGRGREMTFYGEPYGSPEALVVGISKEYAKNGFGTLVDLKAPPSAPPPAREGEVPVKGSAAPVPAAADKQTDAKAFLEAVAQANTATTEADRNTARDKALALAAKFAVKEGDDTRYAPPKAEYKGPKATAHFGQSAASPEALFDKASRLLASAGVGTAQVAQAQGPAAPAAMPAAQPAPAVAAAAPTPQPAPAPAAAPQTASLNTGSKLSLDELKALPIEKRQAIQLAMQEAGIHTGAKNQAAHGKAGATVGQMDGIVGPKTTEGFDALAKRHGIDRDQVIAILVSGDKQQIAALTNQTQTATIAAKKEPNPLHAQVAQDAAKLPGAEPVKIAFNNPIEAPAVAQAGNGPTPQQVAMAKAAGLSPESAALIAHVPSREALSEMGTREAGKVLAGALGANPVSPSLINKWALNAEIQAVTAQKYGAMMQGVGTSPQEVANAAAFLQNGGSPIELARQFAANARDTASGMQLYGDFGFSPEGAKFGESAGQNPALKFRQSVQTSAAQDTSQYALADGYVPLKVPDARPRDASGAGRTTG